MQAATPGQSLHPSQGKTHLYLGHEDDRWRWDDNEGMSTLSQGLPLALGLLGGQGLPLALGLLGGHCLPVVDPNLPPTNFWHRYALSSCVPAATNSAPTTTCLLS